MKNTHSNTSKKPSSDTTKKQSLKVKMGASKKNKKLLIADGNSARKKVKNKNERLKHTMFEVKNLSRWLGCFLESIEGRDLQDDQDTEFVRQEYINFARGASLFPLLSILCVKHQYPHHKINDY